MVVSGSYVKPRFPAIPLESWRDTRDTLHLFLQIVGKIRMRLHPPLNHWWHVSFYLTSRGLSTGLVPYEDRDFDIEFDFVDHWFRIRTSEGGIRQFPLDTLSVADFYKQVFDVLGSLGLQVAIKPIPYQTKCTTPFAEDQEHCAYDRQAIERFWTALRQIASIFEEFRGRFLGKSTPVHLFWHSFDLALTRFSGKAAPPKPFANKVEQEAYSHEVISFGFWPGDDNFPAPAFYSYTYPEPPGLNQQPLLPETAYWTEANGSHMAILPYEEFRRASDPRAMLLEFLESAYQAGARLQEWPIGTLQSHSAPSPV